MKNNIANFNVKNFLKILIVFAICFLTVLLFQPSIYDIINKGSKQDADSQILNIETYESIFNKSCKYNLEDAERIIENSIYKDKSVLRILSTDAVEFTYTDVKCFSRIRYSYEDKGIFYYFYQPLPRRTLVFLIYFLLIELAIVTNKFKQPFEQIKSRVLNFSGFKRVFIGIAIAFFGLSSFMFFYNKIPQIESDISFLNSRFLSIAKPQQLYNESLTMPIFDKSCKYSPSSAFNALENNGFNLQNISIKPYFEKGILNPVAIDFTNFKCWDRIVGATYSQGTKVDVNEKIILYTNPFPRSLVWLLSFLVLFLSFRIQDVLYKSDTKFNAPFYIPNFLINNFHYLLLIITLYQFFTFNTYLPGYQLAFRPLYTVFILGSLYLSYLFLRDASNEKYIIIVSCILIVSSYSYLLFKGVSINEMFTDVDVYQSQLPISILQFEQIKSFGDMFTWNSNLGAGYQLSGQYASDSMIRQFLFSVSPNFNFATNLYFYFHMILGMFIMTLFLKEIGFSSFSSTLGSYIFFTSNQIITWATFLHYPAFILSFSMILFGIIKSKKSPILSSLTIILGFYISSTGAHLQNLFFLYIYFFGFVFITYFFKSLKDKIEYKFLFLSVFISGLVSTYYTMPFFDLLNNLGDREGVDRAMYMITDNLIGFFNNRLLLDSKDVIANYSINLQLFISTLLLFVLLGIRTNNKEIEKFSIVSFLIIYFFSTDNPIQNFVVDAIPGLSLVSNWQRTAPFLIFAVIIYLISKVDTFLTIQNKKSVYLTILFAVFLSSVTRINAFYNVDIQGLRSSYLYSHVQDLKITSSKINIKSENSRILSVCNYNEHLHITPDATLIINNDLYWAGLYESFPNIYFTNKFKTISKTFPGSSGGRYYTHIREDDLIIENLNNLNIEYLLARKDNCEFDKSNLIKIDEFNNYEIYQNLDVEPIIHLGQKNNSFITPDNIERINPELIRVEIKENDAEETLYINEIYSQFWQASINNTDVQINNNNGFMSINLIPGDNEVVLRFNNKNLNTNLKSLISFFRES